MWHARNVPSGSLRVGEVMHVLTRAELKTVGGYNFLTAAGIKDGEIEDGSTLVARVFCCGGPNEVPSAFFAYVPKNVKVEAGDIVEVWSGKMVKQGDPLGAMPNTVTGVAQKASAPIKHCRWVPDTPGLWAKVIYCDWMPASGWKQQKSFTYPLWIDPLNAASPPLDILR